MTLPVRGFTGPLVTRGLGFPFESISVGWWLTDRRPVAVYAPGWVSAPTSAGVNVSVHTATAGWQKQPVGATMAPVAATETVGWTDGQVGRTDGSAPSTPSGPPFDPLENEDTPPW